MHILPERLCLMRLQMELTRGLSDVLHLVDWVYMEGEGFLCGFSLPSLMIVAVP